MLAVSMFILFSCVFDPPKAEDSPPETTQLSLPERLSIDEARVFFAEYAKSLNPLPSYGTRNDHEDIPPPIVLWSEAVYSEFLGHEVIDAPMLDFRVAVYHPDDPGIGVPEDEAPPENAVARLISGLDPDSEIYYRLLYIVPEPEFLAQKELDIADFGLGDTFDNFSGSLMLLEVTGWFVKGFAVSHGQLVKCIFPVKGTPDSGDDTSSCESPAVGTRSDGDCVQIPNTFWINYNYWLDDGWEDMGDGGYVGTLVVASREVTIFTDYCPPTSDNGGETDPSIGNGGGGNSGEGICRNCGKKPCQCCYVCGKPCICLNQQCHKSPCECCTVCKKNDCECDIQVTLMAAGSATLGGNFSMNVSVSPSTAKVDEVRYYINDVLLGCRHSAGSLSSMAKVPGDFRLKAVSIIRGKEYTSNETGIRVDYPSASQVMGFIRTQLELAWTTSLNAANSSGVQEYGGAVYINTKGSTGSATYYCNTVSGTRQTYEDLLNGNNATIDIRTADPDFSTNPERGGIFTVATFHTHPPLWHYRGAVISRRTGPSPEDHAGTGGYPGIVIDFIGGVGGMHKSTDPQTSPKTTYIYGPASRFNP